MHRDLAAARNGHMLRRAKDLPAAPPAPENWRQMVYALIWHSSFGQCPYCKRPGQCTVRIARLSNGWEARDLICQACLAFNPERAGAGACMLSPQALAAERQLYGYEMDGDDYFNATAQRLFPRDEPIVSKLYVEDPEVERRRKRQMLLPCCAEN